MKIPDFYRHEVPWVPLLLPPFVTCVCGEATPVLGLELRLSFPPWFLTVLSSTAPRDAGNAPGLPPCGGRGVGQGWPPNHTVEGQPPAPLIPAGPPPFAL